MNLILLSQLTVYYRLLHSVHHGTILFIAKISIGIVRHERVEKQLIESFSNIYGSGSQVTQFLSLYVCLVFFFLILIWHSFFDISFASFVYYCFVTQASDYKKGFCEVDFLGRCGIAMYWYDHLTPFEMIK